MSLIQCQPPSEKNKLIFDHLLRTRAYPMHACGSAHAGVRTIIVEAARNSPAAPVCVQAAIVISRRQQQVRTVNTLTLACS